MGSFLHNHRPKCWSVIVYRTYSAISRDPKLLTQKISLINTNCKCIILSYKPRAISGLEVYRRPWNFCDCKIILKAIKWMQKIRNKQAMWSYYCMLNTKWLSYSHQQLLKLLNSIDKTGLLTGKFKNKRWTNRLRTSSHWFWWEKMDKIPAPLKKCCLYIGILLWPLFDFSQKIRDSSKNCSWKWADD